MSLSAPNSSMLPMASKSTKGRSKVHLGAGHSLMDWIRLSDRKRLASRSMTSVDEVELAKHSSVSDCWILLGNKVFDVTAYLSYHPGGVDELMRAAGCDATSLFDQYHGWVNYDTMLKSCFVGPFIGDQSKLPETKICISDVEEAETIVADTSNSLHLAFLSSIDYGSNQIKVVFDSTVGVKYENMVTDVQNLELRLLIRPFTQKPHAILWDLPKIPVGLIRSNVDEEGSLTIKLFDENDFPLPCISELKAVEAEPDIFYRIGRIREVQNVTCNIKLFLIDLPRTCNYGLPIGHHLSLRLHKAGNLISRPYTPVRISEDFCTFYFLIKIYEDGIFTPALKRLAEGSNIELSDPVGNLEFPSKCGDDILLLAAGTGITPMLRIIANRLSDPKKSTKMMTFNRSEVDAVNDDVFARCGIDINSSNFTLINYFDDERGSFSKAPDDAVQELVLPYVPKSESCDTFTVMVCGPDGFVLKISRILVNSNVSSSCIHIFQGQP